MMKNLKKVFLTMLMAVMVSTGFTGCGNKSENKVKDVLVETESVETAETVAGDTAEAVESTVAEETESTLESVTETVEETAEETVETVKDIAEADGVKETAQSASKDKEKENVKQKETVNTDKAQNGQTDTKPSTPVSAPAQNQSQNQTQTPEPEKAPASSTTPAPEQKPTPAPEQAPEVKPAVHEHTWVDEVVEATCDTGKVITTKCSSCGHVEGTKTEGSGLGHDFKEIMLYEAACNATGYRDVSCTRCKAKGPGHGDIPMLPHDIVVEVLVEGDCASAKITQEKCRNCGHVGSKNWDWGAHANDHVWVTGTYQKYDETLHAWVDVERTSCSRCGADKPQ